MEETKICKDCKEKKPLTEFYKCSSCKQGVGGVCSQCYIIKYRKKYDYVPGRTRADSDKVEAEKLLVRMGYELNNDDNPIHLQFLRRIQSKYGGLD